MINTIAGATTTHPECAERRSHALLHTDNLGCSRDEKILFKDLAITIAPGEVLVIEGANGSGKTTLLRVLCGLAEPDRGTVFWRGVPINESRLTYYRELIYLSHHTGIKPALTARENLALAVRLHGAGPLAKTIPALEQWGLAGYEDLPCRTLSAGQQRRVGLARLMLTAATLWILDEPFTAMDRRGRQFIETLIHQHCTAGGAVIVTTHHHMNLAEAAVTTLHLGPQVLPT